MLRKSRAGALGRSALRRNGQPNEPTTDHRLPGARAGARVGFSPPEREPGRRAASASDVPAPPYYCTSAPHAILSTDGPESTHESPRHCAGALKWGTGLRNFSSRTEQLRWLARFATPVLARMDCARRKNVLIFSRARTVSTRALLPPPQTKINATIKLQQNQRQTLVFGAWKSIATIKFQGKIQKNVAPLG